MFPLDKTLTIQTSTAVRGAMGDQSFTWANRLADVACAMWPASWTTRQEFGREDVVVEFEIATAIDIAATRNDRIVIGGKTHTVLAYKPFDHAAFGPPLFVTVTGRRNQ